MNVVNGIRNSIVIVALREKEKENENVPRLFGAFPSVLKNGLTDRSGKNFGNGIMGFSQGLKERVERRVRFLQVLEKWLRGVESFPALFERVGKGGSDG